MWVFVVRRLLARAGAGASAFFALMAGAAAFDLEKELEPVLDQGRELAAMTVNDKPFEAGRQQILPPDAGGNAIDKKERVAIINKVKADKGLTGKTAFFDAQRIAIQEGSNLDGNENTNVNIFRTRLGLQVLHSN